MCAMIGHGPWKPHSIFKSHFKSEVEPHSKILLQLCTTWREVQKEEAGFLGTGVCLRTKEVKNFTMEYHENILSSCSSDGSSALGKSVHQIGI